MQFASVLHSAPKPLESGPANGTEDIALRLHQAPSQGDFLGQYRLILQLASGGMASVHAALVGRGAGANRFAAVKLLHPHLVDDPIYRTMFLDEARITSLIRHPNVCGVLDHGEHDGVPYLVMEYLLGEPASSIWNALPFGAGAPERRRRAALVARIVADAAEGLHAAHEAKSPEGRPLGIVHRDVSPENLVVTYDGAVKLCDFGIAIADHQEHRTETGMLKGKYAYIQPEVLRGQRPDRRSDIFSLGVVFWELLTGERLFRRGSAAETLQAVAETLVAAPSTVSPDLPRALDAPVLRALSSNPDERFTTAREFGMAVTAAISSSGQHAGLGEVSEWMAELFPGSRERKEQGIESAAKAYESATPSHSMRVETLPSARDDSEALTLAIPSRPTPQEGGTTLLARAHDGAGTGSKWRRTAATFALGASMGAGFFTTPPSARDSVPPAANHGASFPVRAALAADPTDPARFVAKAEHFTELTQRDPPFERAMACETNAAWSSGAPPVDASPADAMLTDTTAAAPIVLDPRERKADKAEHRAQRPRANFRYFQPLGAPIRVVRPLEIGPLPLPFPPLRLTSPDFLGRPSKTSVGLADPAHVDRASNMVSSIAGE